MRVTSVILALERLRKLVNKFRESLYYTVKICFKKVIFPYTIYKKM